MRDKLVRNQWLVADQALVSSMNFLTTVMLARMLGLHNFGVFTVFYVIMQYLLSIQQALIVSPMMSIAPQIQNQAEHRVFLRGIAGYQRLFSVLCCVAVLVAAALQQLHLIPRKMDNSVILPFMLTIICFQVQDWFRRFCYVQDRGRTVFWNDAISYFGQVVLFGLMWRLHAMSVPGAYYAIAFTSLAAAVTGFSFDWMGSTWREIQSSVSRTWRFGTSLLVSSQSQWLGSQGIFLIVAAISGVSATSGIRAVMTLTGPVTMLFQLLDNVIPVRAARSFSRGGHHDLVQYLRRSGSFLALLIGPPLLIISIFARPIMNLAFGRNYGSFAPLVAWMAFYMLLGLVSRQLVYYHRTLNNTTVLARASMIAATVSVSSCFLLTRWYGPLGCLEALDTAQILNVGILLAAALRKAQSSTEQNDRLGKKP